MLCMFSYFRRLQSGHITCFLDRTYHVLLTRGVKSLAGQPIREYYTRCSSSDRVRVARDARPGGLMWGRRKKLTRLTEELRNIAAVDRLYLIHSDDLTELDHRGYLSRQRRKAEILVEIANL